MVPPRNTPKELKMMMRMAVIPWSKGFDRFGNKFPLLGWRFTIFVWNQNLMRCERNNLSLGSEKLERKKKAPFQFSASTILYRRLNRGLDLSMRCPRGPSSTDEFLPKILLAALHRLVFLTKQTSCTSSYKCKLNNHTGNAGAMQRERT
jgi:hypothetical protein